MYLYSYSCIYIHIHVFIFTFMYLYSHSCIYIHIRTSIYIHIHVFIFIFMYLYSHSCYIFSHSSIYFHIHVTFSNSWLCYAWFCSFICMVYFHGTRESECITSHSYSAHQTPFYVLTIPDNPFWSGAPVWSSSQISGDLMPSITNTIKP